MKIVNKKNKKLHSKYWKNLFTSGFPDTDILIRTGGQKRLSNFLLWQIAYAEIFFIKKMWPDFNNNDFQKILINLKKLKEILVKFSDRWIKKKNYYFYLIIFISYFLCFYKLANIYFIYHNSFRNCFKWNCCFNMANRKICFY